MQPVTGTVVNHTVPGQETPAQPAFPLFVIFHKINYLKETVPVMMGQQQHAYLKYLLQLTVVNMVFYLPQRQVQPVILVENVIN